MRLIRHPVTAVIAFLLMAAAVALDAGEPAPGKSAPAGMVSVPAGIYRPLFRGPDDLREVPVKALWLEEAPVTNTDFLEFVRQNPQWRRSRVARLFADSGYLRHWAGDLDPGPGATDLQPVVDVSWFAAKAYATWKGRRLLTTAEWELAASIGPDHRAGTNDPGFLRAIQHWYVTPTPAVLPVVKTRRPNLDGVHDLHGLIWEWTADFNSALVSGDARGDTGLDRQLFCGAGSLGATDRSNFPAFMRFGFRSSLKASYTLPNLGFRCALDVPVTPVASVTLTPSPAP